LQLKRTGPMSTSSFEKFAATADAFFSTAQAIQGQRAQMANYAMNKAAQYMQDNQTDNAIKEFKKALAFDPANTTAMTYMGNLYLSQGKTFEAIKSFKEVVRQQPTSVNAHVNLGNAYLQEKNYTNAEKEYKTAERMDPLNPIAGYTLGHQYMQTGRLNEAEAQFLKTQKVSPKDGNVYYSLGAVYNKQEKYELAAANLEKALTLKKDFDSANYELGIAYSKLGRTDDAQSQLAILKKSNTALANDLQFVLNKPRMVSMNTSKSGGFSELLGPGTPLWMLDVQNVASPDSLLNPGTSKKFSIAFNFTNEMDVSSVMNPLNWSISRGKTAASGYYNNTMPVNTAREVSIPPIPLSVSYDPTNRQAIVNFRISQNDAGNATIDPKHLVFKFSGKDAAGRQMDTTGDEIDGSALSAF